jgi:DNA-binding transcriptional MocR family regulator
VSFNFQKPTPLYFQNVDHIKKQFSLGYNKENNQLSSQQELAHEYNVRLITVKCAINMLIKGKVLYSCLGQGGDSSLYDCRTTNSLNWQIGSGGNCPFKLRKTGKIPDHH